MRCAELRRFLVDIAPWAVFGAASGRGWLAYLVFLVIFTVAMRLRDEEVKRG